MIRIRFIRTVIVMIMLAAGVYAADPVIDLIRQADQLYEAAQYAEALTIYVQIKAAPTPAYSETQLRAACRIAECQYALGQYAEAAASFEELLARSPHGARRYAPDLHYGDCLVILGRTNQAIRCYNFVYKNCSTNYHINVQARIVEMEKKRPNKTSEPAVAPAPQVQR